MAIRTITWNDPALWMRNSTTVTTGNNIMGSSYSTVVPEDASGTRIALKTPAVIPTGTYTLHVNSGYHLCVLAFRDDDTYVGSGGVLLGFYDNSNELTVTDSTYRHLGILVRKASGTLLTESIADAGLVLTYEETVVLAANTITLATVVDVQSCTRYYLLQSSTLNPPAKPTTKPPGGSWDDTEPTYTSGSTNSLYFCDLTLFSDGTWSYSNVSKSSAYEAAKEAYNRAIAAGQTAEAAQTAAELAATNIELLGGKVSSRGGQLITNGTGIMGDNTNFSSFVYDPLNACNGSNGSFTRTSPASPVMLDEYVPLMGGVDYRLEFDLKSQNGRATAYSLMRFYDADKLTIVSSQIMFVPGTLTTLTQDLAPGDTVVHLADLSGWSTNNTSATHQRGFILWNYTNSFGYTYPPETYSRKVYGSLFTDANVNKNAGTITLTNPWPAANGAVPAGTKVSQRRSGSTYKYIAIEGSAVPNTWTHYKGVMHGETDLSGQNKSDMLPPGAAYCKVGFLWNYNSASDTLWVANVSLKEDYWTAIDKAQEDAEQAQDAADRAQDAADDAQESADANARAIQLLDQSVSGLSTQFNVFSSGIEATIEDHSEILSAMSFSTEGMKIQMAGSIYYTLTDDVGYHIYQNDKEIASFSEGKGKMDELQIGGIICRRTSKGGWVWTGVT